MNTVGRTSHPSRAQIEELLNFMEENPSLAKGFSKIPSARDGARKKWERLALRLNSMGGSVKSWKQWTKYWADKKSAVKKKAAQRSAARRRTGGGAEEVELSQVEERIVMLLGGESFAVGDQHLAIPLFESETQSQNDAMMRSTSTPTTTEPMDPDEADAQGVVLDVPIRLVNARNIECVAGTSFQSNRQSHVVHVPVQQTPPPDMPPPTPARPSGPSADGPRSSPSSPTSGALPVITPPPRRRRRIQIPGASPPSQRRSQLSSLTERFLRLEEQRLEVERRNSQILESLLARDNERDQMVAHALRAVGEGLKLLAEALNKNT